MKHIGLAMICGVQVLALAGCDSKANGSAKPAAAKTAAALAVSAPMADKSLPKFQVELLSLAMDAATAIPVDPHIADRSKSQQRVVEAFLTLDQPERAERCAEAIEDWRRGACYADLAYYFAQHKRPEAAPRCLDLATSIAKRAEDWSRDAIRVRIARAHAALGNAEQAREFERDVMEAEQGKVAGVKAMLAGDDSFDEEVKALDALLAPGNFDIAKNSLEAYTQLHNRFYADAKRRTLAEDRIKSSWSKMPIFIRIELLEALAGSALDHGDPAHSLELVNEAQTMAEGYEWPLEARIPIAAKLARLRYKSGDQAKAKADADAVFALYKIQGTLIVNVFRAEALRPLAEAYEAMGDRAGALSVYKKAVEEGHVNPNSRPRAEDLSATCCSMALAGVEPDADLWARLREIRAGLGDPW